MTLIKLPPTWAHVLNPCVPIIFATPCWITVCLVITPSLFYMKTCGNVWLPTHWDLRYGPNANATDRPHNRDAAEKDILELQQKCQRSIHWHENLAFSIVANSLSYYAPFTCLEMMLSMVSDGSSYEWHPTGRHHVCTWWNLMCWVWLPMDHLSSSSWRHGKLA